MPAQPHRSLALALSICCAFLLLAGPALAQPALRVLPSGFSAVRMSNDGQVVVGNGFGGMVWTPSGGVESVLPYDEDWLDDYQFQDVSADGRVAIVHNTWGSVGLYDLNARAKISGGGDYEYWYSRLSPDGAWGIRNYQGGGPGPSGSVLLDFATPGYLWLPRPAAAGPKDPYWESNGVSTYDLSAGAQLVVGYVAIPEGSYDYSNEMMYWTPSGGSQLLAPEINPWGGLRTNDLGPRLPSRAAVLSRTARTASTAGPRAAVSSWSRRASP